IELPGDGNDTIHMHTGDGFEIEVREVGAGGRGAIVERAVTYPRAGGSSYWTTAPGIAEEWLHLSGRRDGIEAAWEVSGGSIEQRGEEVAILDEVGVARLWVSAPVGYATGEQVVPIAVKLAVRGSRIELSVPVGAEDVLVDPVWTPRAPM